MLRSPPRGPRPLPTSIGVGGLAGASRRGDGAVAARGLVAREVILVAGERQSRDRAARVDQRRDLLRIDACVLIRDVARLELAPCGGRVLREHRGREPAGSPVAARAMLSP